jgi:hypothetical protein
MIVQRIQHWRVTPIVEQSGKTVERTFRGALRLNASMERNGEIDPF